MCNTLSVARLVEHRRRLWDREWDLPNTIEMPGLGPALMFAVATLLSMVGVVVLSGHFPRRARQAPISGAASEVALYGLVLSTLAAIAGAVLLAVGALPWYAAIIIGGLAIVSGPLVEQRLPLSLRVSTKGIVLLMLLEFAAAAASIASV